MGFAWFERRGPPKLQNRKHQNNNNNNKRRKKKTTSAGLCKRDRKTKGRRRPPVWVRAREREKKKSCRREKKKLSMWSPHQWVPQFLIYLQQCHLALLLKNWKLLVRCSQNTVFKHHKLRIVTQTPLVKHSYQTLFFLKSRSKNIKELEKTTNLRWNEEL